MNKHEIFDPLIPQEPDPDSGLPIGTQTSVTPAKQPQKIVLEGQYCRLEPISQDHCADLFRASTPTDAAALFLYLPEAVPQSESEMTTWIENAIASTDPLYFAVIDKATGRCVGRQTLMRITPEHQSIEIGNIYWGPDMAGTRIATEANFLFVRYAFDELGYRRYEWKCNALNVPSRSAALRFGFQYEGHFRRAVIVRGRTRDTSWFSIINEEWPALKAAYEQWLAPENFDGQGVQKTRLSELTAAALAKTRNT